jgi:hypothetical protein
MCNTRAQLNPLAAVEIMDSTMATGARRVSLSPHSFDGETEQEAEEVSPSTRSRRVTLLKNKRQASTKHQYHNGDRPVVKHNYHDFAGEPNPDKDQMEEEVHDHDDEVVSSDEDNKKHSKRSHRGGVTQPFPERLHDMLEHVEQDGLSHIISWQPHGRCFLVHDPKAFVATVMPSYFKQSKLTSFQRQLNLYGFCRLTSGPDRNAYYHELFLRGKPFLCKRMYRTRIKGIGIKKASNPSAEPDFYKMPFVENAKPSTSTLAVAAAVAAVGRPVTAFSSSSEMSDNEEHGAVKSSPVVKKKKKKTAARVKREPAAVALVPPPPPVPSLVTLSFDDVPEEVTSDLVKSFSEEQQQHHHDDDDGMEIETPLLAPHRSLEAFRAFISSSGAMSTPGVDKDLCPPTQTFCSKADFEPPKQLVPFVTPPSSPSKAQAPCSTVVPPSVATMYLNKLQKKEQEAEGDTEEMVFEGRKFHFLDSPSFDLLDRVHADMDQGFPLWKSYDDLSAGVKITVDDERKELSCEGGYFGGRHRARAA